MTDPSPSRSFWDTLPERPLHLGVLAFVLLLYVPMAGSYGFWDPWETHYGEVARQMVERGDWISLWWPGSNQDNPPLGEFWSKPVFTFWIFALSMKLFGLGAEGNPAGEMALSFKVEWACRLPEILFGAMGVYAVFWATRRLFGRRPAVIAAVATATSPMYALLSRQAMTDMPFVGPMTAALALALVALVEEDGPELPRRTKGRFSWPQHPAFYLAAGTFILVVLPQLLVDSIQLRVPVGNRRFVPGVVYMLPFIATSAASLWLLARAKHPRQLYLHLAFTLCAVATLAKGLVGVLMPGLILVAFLAVTWDFRQILRLEVLSGVLTVASAAFPWYVAMLLRHGQRFWSEFFGDNHWNRLAVGRHGDRGTFEYFLRELGIGTLPWCGAAPLALAAAADRARGKTSRERALAFVLVWFIVAFAVVSASMTKFHHYILPAIPPLAMLIGWFLDDALAEDRAATRFAVALTGIPVVLLVVRSLTFDKQQAQKLLWLFNYDYVHNPRGRTWPAELDFRTGLWVVGALACVAFVLYAVPLLRKAGTIAIAAAGAATGLYVIDEVLVKTTPYWSQKAPIAAYYRAKGPKDRLVAWQMYWRGETFYSKNEVYDHRLRNEDKTVFLGDRNQEDLAAFLKRHVGERFFFIVEQGRFSTLKTLMPTEQGKQSLKVIESSTNKYYMAEATL